LFYCFQAITFEPEMVEKRFGF